MLKKQCSVIKNNFFIKWNEHMGKYSYALIRRQK